MAPRLQTSPDGGVVVRSFSWMLALILIAGCGRNPLGVQFDSSVPGNQKGYMQTDLSRLSSMQLPMPSSTELYYLGLGDTSPASLSYWMQARMKYVVGESFNYKSSAQKIDTSSTLLDSVDPTQLGAAQTVMMNLGSFLYLDAKGTNTQYVISLAGALLNIVSPRVDILQIGSGLFDANSIPGIDLGAYSNSILRIATYFHEGRHSDGNGENAGFPHGSCPSGKYSGLYACENNVNGPYAIQTIILRQAAQACPGCSSTELAGLDLSIADYASRQIGYQLPDPTPESYQGVGAVGSFR